MKFKGKVANWYYFIVAVVLVVMAYPLILFIATKETMWIIFQTLFLLICIVICVPPLLHNYVEVKEDSFIVYFGLSKKHILIQDVVTMYKSRDLTAGSAASLDRIYISTRNDDLLISLKDNDGFIQFIMDKNPTIKNS